VPQKDGFEERSTGREALAFLARLRGVDGAQVDEYARMVGVDELLERPVGTLSGGQRQKLSLAAALLGDPPVLLLDEPTASLDPRATAGFRKLVERLATEGRTIVLCSHLLSDVERLCHRVLILLDGRVEGVEPKRAPGPADLFVDIDNTAKARDLLTSFGAETTWMNGSGLLARMSGEDQVRLLALLSAAGVPIRSFETRRPSLEERFLEAVRPETDANDD
jgi:ABC-type multidrug transport system ATPase subunit